MDVEPWSRMHIADRYLLIMSFQIQYRTECDRENERVSALTRTERNPAVNEQAQESDIIMLFIKRVFSVFAGAISAAKSLDPIFLIRRTDTKKL